MSKNSDFTLVALMRWILVLLVIGISCKPKKPGSAEQGSALGVEDLASFSSYEFKYKSASDDTSCANLINFRFETNQVGMSKKESELLRNIVPIDSTDFEECDPILGAGSGYIKLQYQDGAEAVLVGKECKFPESSNFYSIDPQVFDDLFEELKPTEIQSFPRTFPFEFQSFQTNRDSVYYNFRRIELADKDSFEPLDRYFARDNNRHFYNSQEIQGADYSSFERLTGYFSRDHQSVFTGSKKLEGVHYESFQALNFFWAKDQNAVYEGDRRITDKLDVASFECLNDYYCKDANRVLFVFSLTEFSQADLPTFQVMDCSILNDLLTAAQPQNTNLICSYIYDACAQDVNNYYRGSTVYPKVNFGP